MRPVLALAMLLLGCAPPPASVESLAGDPARDRVITVPVTDAAGLVTPIYTRICRPASDAPAPLVVINHGSPADAAARPRMQLRRCGGEEARWFLSRGYVVAFPLRRGYGITGGPAAEASRSCAEVDFVRSGLETARDIQAVVDRLTTVPFVRPDRAVVLGQSAGGWGSLAFDSLPHPRVAAIISMAGGRGGHYQMRPNNNCHPERLIEAAGHFGATASTPMLWIYTANDSFFDPALARSMYQAFTQAGGSAEFEQLGPYGSDGHELFFGRGGSVIWGEPVKRYLAERRALP